MKTLHQIICTSLLFTAFIFAGASAHAQDINSQNRDISLKVLNKKGRPVNNVVVHSLKTGIAGITNYSGLFIFANIPDDDTISVILPKYGNTRIPVSGMDSIVVTVRSSAKYHYRDNSGQTVIIGKNVLEMSTVLNVPEMLKKRSYKSLSELLQGQISARGISSVNSGTQPLVVVDGMPVGTIADVNPIINVYDIKTIEILKDAFEWGARGANGVIVVKTR